MKNIIGLLKEALTGSEKEYTSGGINKAIFLLSVPMILEMVMESLFAIVDIFFVSKIGVDAVASVGLTESVLTIIYSVAIGIGMAATALVSRRIGEGKPEEAGQVVGQVIIVSLSVALVLSVLGGFFAGNILHLMGASAGVLGTGESYARLVFISAPAIVLLYTLCGALRGAGAAAIAMRSLWIANGINIVLCPIFIFGVGPIPGYGVTGAAMATTIGRSVGVAYQLYYLGTTNSGFSLKTSFLRPVRSIIDSLMKLAAGGAGQFLIASASWVFLTRIVAEFGSDAVAGYTIAIRVLIFTLMPASGLANAASTLVGQNLGAGQPERAETSVWRTAFANMVFLVVLAVLFFWKAEAIIGWFNDDPAVVHTGVMALKILSLGYGFYAYGMVVISSLNGAGDTRTPTFLNLLCFWFMEIPLAYLLSMVLGWGTAGVFASVPIAESVLAVLAILVFRRGKWKKVQV